LASSGERMIGRDLREIDPKLSENSALMAFARIAEGTGFFTRLFLWFHRERIVDILDREFRSDQSTVMYRALHGFYGPPIEPKPSDYVKARVVE